MKIWKLLYAIFIIAFQIKIIKKRLNEFQQFERYLTHDK